MQDDRLTIRIGSALKAKLQARATLEERSVTEIVVRSLSQSAARWQPTGKKEQTQA